MRFIHISDLHIGLKLINRDLYEDQQYILGEIVRLAGGKQPDAVVVAGDIYDRAVPSAEAVALFDDFVGQLREAVPDACIMMISGNHDSATRIDCYRSVLSRQKLYMAGNPPMQEDEHVECVELSDEYGPVRFYLLPFIKPSMVKAITGVDDDGNNLSYDAAVRFMIEREAVDTSVRNVLVSHQFYLPVGKGADAVERMESEIVTVGNIDQVGADVLSPFDYAALGHIHKPMKVGSEVYRYCGTPLQCSVSEAGQQKGIILVDMKEKGCVTTEVLPLTPLHQVKVVKGTLEEVLLQKCGDYVTVVLTDTADHNAVDMQDRLRTAFPRLLEVRRENIRKADTAHAVTEEAAANPYELCRSFLGTELSEEEDALLSDVINTVLEGGTAE